MNIYGFTVKKLEDYFSSIGENPAKAKIVFRAVYRDKINAFSEIEKFITSSPLECRESQ